MKKNLTGRPNDDGSKSVSNERIKLERANHLYVAAIGVSIVLVLGLSFGMYTCIRPAISCNFDKRFQWFTKVR